MLIKNNPKKSITLDTWISYTYTGMNWGTRSYSGGNNFGYRSFSGIQSFAYSLCKIFKRSESGDISKRSWFIP